MKLFGLEIKRANMQVVGNVPPGAGGGGWFNVVKEGFAGAFQSRTIIDGPRQLLAFSGVYACVTLIAQDIAKLGAYLMVEGRNGIFSRVDFQSPYMYILDRPNPYQTWMKFVEQWVVSKLLYGNTYVLKSRDKRGIVNAMYILDASRVLPLITESGDVYYDIPLDNLTKVKERVAAPSTEVMHDSMVGLWHPLVGISPIYSCGISATMGNRIQSNSTNFFANASRPSGMLTSPNEISDTLAARLKEQWEEKYGGSNVGRLAVGGNGLTYAPMSIPATDAQLIEQLRWTIEDVARCFHVPTWKIGDKEPARTSVESLNQTYYSDCLQAHIESMEATLTHGLELPQWYSVEFALEGLLRMDTAARYLAKGQAVKDGWMAPNEARSSEDLQPVPGGDSCYLQQQNYSLDALSKRDAKENPFENAVKPAAPAQSVQTIQLLPPPPAPEAGEDDSSELLDYIARNLKWAA